MSKVERATAKIGAVIVPLTALWRATGGKTVRDESGKIAHVDWMGVRVFDRERARARRARRAARREKGAGDGDRT